MSSQTGVPFLGSKITLISKTGIRYEGTLFNIDANNNSVALKDVRMFGTEGRRTDGKQIPALDKLFEYITFKGDDIRDLTVCEVPSQQMPQQQQQKQQQQQQQQKVPQSTLQSPATLDTHPVSQDTGKPQIETKTAETAQQQPNLQSQQPTGVNMPGNQGAYGGMGTQYPYYNPYMPNPFMGPYGWSGQGGPMGMNPQQLQMLGPYGYPYQQHPGFDPFQQAQPFQQQQQQIPTQIAKEEQQKQQPHKKELLLIQPSTTETAPEISEQREAKEVKADLDVKKTVVEQQTATVAHEIDVKAVDAQNVDVQTDDIATVNGATNTRGRGGRRGGTHRRARPRERFDGEFDFQSANAQFDKLSLKEELGDMEEEDADTFYDKSRSFFDNISRDTKEGSRSRQERELQNRLDYETFGTTSRRYRGRGGRGGRGGTRGRGGRGTF